MIIEYRLHGTNGYMVGESRGMTKGVIRRYDPVKHKTKQRAAHYPSECDWMVPNLVNPYKDEPPCPIFPKTSAPSLTN